MTLFIYLLIMEIKINKFVHLKNFVKKLQHRKKKTLKMHGVHVLNFWK